MRKAYVEYTVDSFQKTIDDMSTADIINYLMKREGVAGFRVEPYNKGSVIVDGPAVVIIVTD